MKTRRFDAQSATTITLAAAFTFALGLGAKFLSSANQPTLSATQTETVQTSASQTTSSNATTDDNVWGDDSGYDRMPNWGTSSSSSSSAQVVPSQPSQVQVTPRSSFPSRGTTRGS